MLQENYNKFPALTWQYYIDRNTSDYVQFPANNRHCHVDLTTITPYNTFDR